MEDKYLDVAGACKFLKISRATLFKLKKEGELPYIQATRSLVFDRDDLIEWMNKYKKVDKK